MIEKQPWLSVFFACLVLPLAGCLVAEDADTVADDTPTPQPVTEETVEADETGAESPPLEQVEPASDPNLQKAVITYAPPTPVEAKISIEELCKRIAKKLHSVHKSDCNTSVFHKTDGVSVLGNPLLMHEYGRINKVEPQGRVLLIGGIHGDEYSSVSIVFHWMRTLNKYHTGLFQWRVVPLLNPDGLLRHDPQRMNNRGVDLNRNFPTPNWKSATEKYWKVKTRKNPRRYPGPSALSEPESQWLVELIKEFKPDVIVSVHAPYGILDFDGPRTAPKHLGHLHLNVLGTYPGSLGNYAGVQNKIPVVTIELPYAGIMPKPTEVSRIWSDLVTWLKKHVKEDKSLPNVVVTDKKGQMEPS